MCLSYAVAFSLFLLLEFYRHFRVWPLGSLLDRYMTSFINPYRLMGTIWVLDHFYLLLGCAIPLWLSISVGVTHPVATLSGVLSLGISDAAAAVIGIRYGTMRWPGSNRTVQGTAAFIITLCGSYFLLCHVLQTDFTLPMVLMIAMTGLFEAFLEHNDNLFVPLYMLSMLLLFNTPAQLDYPLEFEFL